MEGKILLSFAVIFTLLGKEVLCSDLDISFTGHSVYKCCPEHEILFGQYLDHCRHINETDSSAWTPHFYDKNQCFINSHIAYKIIPGLPNCGSQERQPVYEYHDSPDKLVLHLDGTLRHYTHFKHSLDIDEQRCINPVFEYASNFFDHRLRSYCLDKSFVGGLERATAIVCVPQVVALWDAERVLLRIVDPVLRVLAICCLLTVAVVYFILPSLRDLVGSMLSTITVSLIVSQIASIVRIFTQFNNHVSFLVADLIMYMSLMAAFFWLSSLGYYIWRMFRSRNMFLRVSDGRKYCYYSACAWGSTLVMTLLALLAHFLFDSSKGGQLSPHDQDSIGWIGIAIFFIPIAFSILLNLFFYLSTARLMSRILTYGHIQTKFKLSFQLFLQTFGVMTAAWVFLLLSWLHYDYLIFANIFANALQAILILTICVLSRKRVRQLLQKTYCQRNTETHWGEEMISMTSG